MFCNIFWVYPIHVSNCCQSKTNFFPYTLAYSAKLLSSPAHSSASRTNSNNSGASGSVASATSNKTSSDNFAQSQKSSSSEMIQHHTTRTGSSASSKSAENNSSTVDVDSTLDSTLKDEGVPNILIVSGNDNTRIALYIW